MNDSGGATINPHAIQDKCPRLDNKTGSHAWRWQNDPLTKLPTNNIQCATCGEIRTNDRNSPVTLQKGHLNGNPI